MRAWHVGVILAVWAAVALPWIGAGGLTMTEGHRVIPAVEMLRTGEWLVPHMFEQPYLRKPPGAMWAFAGMIALTGDAVLGPRLVSAAAFALMALAAWWFGRRWFGSTAGLIAGIATLLMPLMWKPARAAELEMLNNLFTALAAWTLLELVLRRACRPNWATLALAAFVAAFLLIKGPAGLPALGGLLIGAAWATRSWRALANPRAWIGAGFGAAAFGGVWLVILARARAMDPTPVVQSPGAFLFEPGQLLDLAAFLPSVFVTALPLSLAALFPFGRDAVGEAGEAGRAAERELVVARALAMGVLAGAGVMMLAGVSNPRYAQPVVGCLGPLVGWAVVAAGRSGVFRPHRKRIARVMMLGGAWVIGGLLVAGSGVHKATAEARMRATSGQAAGAEAARALADRLRADGAAGPVIVLADGVVEARPEALLGFRDEAARLGTPVRVLWIPQIARSAQTSELNAAWLATGGWLVLRRDERGDETPAFPDAAAVFEAPVHKFRFVWMRGGQPVGTGDPGHTPD